MARRILFAEEFHSYAEGRPALKIDDVVIPRSGRYSIAPQFAEGETGSSSIFSWEFWWDGRIRLPNGYYHSPIDPHGVLTSKSDIGWLSDAMDNEPELVVCRVNMIDVVDGVTGQKGFEIEVCTGADARQIARSERVTRFGTWVTTHWWQIGVAVLVAWWWFT